MEMFLYFSLEFQFPIPDPSVCGTIYSIPFKTSQGGKYVSVPGGINHQIYYYLNSLKAYQRAKCKALQTGKGFLWRAINIVESVKIYKF